jgi:hypothetical protein
MNKPTYSTQNIDAKTYTFLSTGKKGIILKVVVFDKIEDNLYNLGFGDYNFSNNTIDDKVKSKNGDMEKVLATVLAIMHDFLTKNADCSIYLTGSNELRTRLYQLAITKYFDDFSLLYQIFGRYGDTLEPFQKNESYESFLVRKLLNN